MLKCLLLEHHTMSDSLAAMITACDLGRQEVGRGAHAVPHTTPEVGNKLVGNLVGDKLVGNLLGYKLVGNLLGTLSSLFFFLSACPVGSFCPCLCLLLLLFFSFQSLLHINFILSFL